MTAPKRPVARPRKTETKKPVGRPRKIVTEAKKPVGRPRKIVTETAPKKPVGRPRKIVTETKKPVGRPRKIVTETAPKKPVGRPRKIVTETAPKKPVGRPLTEAGRDVRSLKVVKEKIKEKSVGLKATRETMRGYHDDEAEKSLARDLRVKSKEIMSLARERKRLETSVEERRRDRENERDDEENERDEKIRDKENERDGEKIREIVSRLERQTSEIKKYEKDVAKMNERNKGKMKASKRESTIKRLLESKSSLQKVKDEQEDSIEKYYTIRSDMEERNGSDKAFERIVDGIMSSRRS